MSGLNQLLKIGQKLTTAPSGLPCDVRQYLGGGGQGEVYRADLAGQSVAVKWYFPQQATRGQRTALEALVRKGPPTSDFLWPMQIAVAPGKPGFGYVMPLRTPNFKGMVDLMKRRVEPSFRTLVTAGFNLAQGFLELHSGGMAYRDISFGNVFFDPDTGEIRICDNDNVAVDGVRLGGITGTQRFMAPEVVVGRASPSADTDLFSLAVLLFYMCVMHHPLEGRLESAIHAFDEPAMRRIYGEHPVFIFDPTDHSNRPVHGFHDNAIAFWPIYPRFFQALFIQTFTVGIREPHGGRVVESVWRGALVRLRDSIFHCGCGAEQFFDEEQPERACWNCGKMPTVPPLIRIGRQLVTLAHNTKLYPHHVAKTPNYDFSRPVAELATHPSKLNVWGLRNVGTTPWRAIAEDGAEQAVEPGRSISLAKGLAVDFGDVRGQVELH